MEEKKSRILLYQLRAEVRRKTREMVLSKYHYKFAANFLKQHSADVYICATLLVVTIFLELLLPIVCHIYVARFAELLARSTFFFSLCILAIGVIIYLLSTFGFIKKRATLEIQLINDLRKKWFVNFLNKPAEHVKQNDTAKLMAKITYHFSLLRMGLSSSLIGIIKWALTMSGLLIITFFIDTKLFVFTLAAIPVHAILFLIGYHIAKVYVSKEATLYSEIIRVVANSMLELKFLEKHKLRKKTLDYFDSVVNLDLYFRVRRNLWLEYGFRCLFALVLLGTGVAYFVQLHYPAIVGDYNLSSFVAPGIIIAYVISLCYVSLRAGLFFIPLKLGLILSVPEHSGYLHLPKKSTEFSSFDIFARKVKLSPLGNYLKNVKFSFRKNSRVLITGENCSGKSYLAALLAGDTANNLSPWMVKKDDERMSLTSWKNQMTDSYYISTVFYTDRTINEIILGKDRRDISDSDIEKIYKILSKHSAFAPLINAPRSTAANFNLNRMGTNHIFLVQAAYCLINKPCVITVDNLWLDLNYGIINKALRVLDQELTDSILIYTSLNDNNIINYDQKYKITSQTVEKQENVV